MCGKLVKIVRIQHDIRTMRQKQRVKYQLKPVMKIQNCTFPTAKKFRLACSVHTARRYNVVGKKKVYEKKKKRGKVTR